MQHNARDLEIAATKRELLNRQQQFPLWEKTQVVAAISQSRQAFYATLQNGNY